jgi:hypothetical protein
MTRGMFVARYRGECAVCDEPIVVDDVLRYNSDDEVVHAHHLKRSQLPARTRPTEVCPVCNLIKPCDCDDPVEK